MSLFFNTIEKISLEHDYEKYSPEKLYQIWTRAQTISNINSQGYAVLNYLEDFVIIRQNQYPEEFFLLIIQTFAKNEYFYRLILNDRKRLLQTMTMKSVCFMRYLQLLYCYCPRNLVNNVGVDFYRFVIENYFKEKSINLDGLTIFSNLVYQFYENNGKNSIFIDQKQMIEYCFHVIDTLLQHRFTDLKSIETITKTIATVWEQTNHDSSTSIPMRSIEYLFHSISSDQCRTTSTPAILPLFAHIQLDLADTTLKSMFSDGCLTGERLSNMIRYLIILIDAPIELLQSMSYETWITGLCNALVSFHQHEYLRNLIDEYTSFFIDRLVTDQTFDYAFQILFWFILYDKRLDSFRMLIDRLPKLFEQFQLHHHDERKTRMIELCHMAMAIHPDYEINNGMLFKEILHTLPQPDLNILANHRATHARFHSIVSETKTKIKNRLGIINLGNTCYVSSVLQALYQCDLFRKYILEHHFHEQAVLKELQMIFGQLYLSKRPFINAIHLMKIARPAWFIMNEQQDCAEFLGYLLDTIKDEEKKDRTSSSSNEIERFFTIRTCQINRCQTCGIESYREELSNYLFLPIPTGEQSHEMNNSNHSAIPISITRNGLKFSAAFNDNSTSDDQVKSLATALVQPDQISRSSSSTPPSYDSLMNRSLNLQFVFDCYFQKEDLKDENQYRCEHCRSLQDAERLIILQNAPEYLILSLNRFEYDKSTNTFRKVFTKINYPKVLHVRIYPSETSRNQSILINYCLVLVIVHTGYTLHGGHYYVYAREIKSSVVNNSVDEQEDYFANDEWFLLNDDLVTLSSYEAMIENCAQYTSATPYILFYKRVDPQRMEQIERTKDIQVHENLLAQKEDNRLYERDKDAS